MDGLNGAPASSWLRFQRNHMPAVRVDAARRNEGAPVAAAIPACASCILDSLTPVQAEYALIDYKRAGLRD